MSGDDVPESEPLLREEDVESMPVYPTIHMVKTVRLAFITLFYATLLIGTTQDVTVRIVWLPRISLITNHHA